MLEQRDRRASLAVGFLAAAVGAGYGVVTDALRLPVGPVEGAPLAMAFLYAAFVVVPFGLGAGAALVAVRHRVVVPLVALAALAAVPAVVGWHSGLLVAGVLLVGPFLAVFALAETLARASVGRLANPPAERGFRALSVGVMAALVYAGVFAVRAVVPLWRIDTGAPSVVPPTANLVFMLWYVLGASLLLVGVPVALNRRFGLLAPAVGLLAYLLVDLAYVQPAVAGGTELVVALLLGGWPTLAVLLSAVGALEWWLRNRRGEYDGDDGEPDDDEGGGESKGGPTVEGGLFGDRV